MAELPSLARLRSSGAPTAKLCDDDGDWPLSDGACVILFTSHRSRPCITLFQDKHTGLWEHAGGGCDASEAPERAAARELREETGNLFHIPPEELEQPWIAKAQYGPYRGYGAKVEVSDDTGGNALNAGDFEANMEKILAAGTSKSSWREMRKMTQVQLSTLLDTGLLAGNFWESHHGTYDVNGKWIMFRNRDAAILRNMWLSPGSVPGPVTPALQMRRRTGYKVTRADDSQYLYQGERQHTFLNGTTWYSLAAPTGY